LTGGLIYAIDDEREVIWQSAPTNKIYDRAGIVGKMGERSGRGLGEGRGGMVKVFEKGGGGGGEIGEW